MTVTERDRDLMRVLRSSFGLLGVVHEVVLRVRPMMPVRIDYQVLTLKEFSARYASLVARARRVAPAHLAVRATRSQWSGAHSRSPRA